MIASRQTLISSPPGVMKWRKPIRGGELELRGSCCLFWPSSFPLPRSSSRSHPSFSASPLPPPPVSLRGLFEYHSSSFSHVSSARGATPRWRSRSPTPPRWPIRCDLPRLSEPPCSPVKLHQIPPLEAVKAEH